MKVAFRFIDKALPKLSRAEIAVWLILLRLAEKGGIVRNVPQWEIANRAGCDWRTVQRAMRTLKKAGLLKVRTGRNGERSEYRVTSCFVKDFSAVDDTGDANKS